MDNAELQAEVERLTKIINKQRAKLGEYEQKLSRYQLLFSDMQQTMHRGESSVVR